MTPSKKIFSECKEEIARIKVALRDFRQGGGADSAIDELNKAVLGALSRLDGVSLLFLIEEISVDCNPALERLRAEIFKAALIKEPAKAKYLLALQLLQSDRSKAMYLLKEAAASGHVASLFIRFKEIRRNLPSYMQKSFKYFAYFPLVFCTVASLISKDRSHRFWRYTDITGHAIPELDRLIFTALSPFHD